jgi:hypothetical protein
MLAGCANVPGCEEVAALPEGPPLIPGFRPDPPGPGEIQIRSPAYRAIQPGEEVMLCSYLDAELNCHLDVVHFQGFLSPGGHHAILYTARQRMPVGTHPCTPEDHYNGRFLAATGSDVAIQNAAQVIPPGSAFRLEGGSQLYIQTHWVNSSSRPIDGQAAFNLAVRPHDGSRMRSAMFLSGRRDLVVPPGMSTQSADCTLRDPLQFYALAGHAHKLATRVEIDLLRPDGSSQLHATDWKPEYFFNPPFEFYPAGRPLCMGRNDVLRVTCTWNNTTGRDVHFPAEMCLAFGFFAPASKGDIYCLEGVYK